MMQSIMLYIVGVTFESVNKNIQLKATEQYFPVMQIIVLYIVGVTFGLVNETFRRENSNASYLEISPYDAGHHAVHCRCNI